MGNPAMYSGMLAELLDNVLGEFEETTANLGEEASIEDYAADVVSMLNRYYLEPDPLADRNESYKPPTFIVDVMGDDA
ncbi:hypothetical protein A5747_13455 [Mycobacterium sp. IS-836]|uniref:hypothetical protein n=1 Tax=Mycobacterium sp. IS-836 TaxID=1834160 RepID=UPI00096E0F7A|nr:hypothetical protein [Mycobacterium sp. IS-836]OMC55394.1 hypothetical protein A5747_13455 [Mycobacterium sp. IS-836]